MKRLVEIRSYKLNPGCAAAFDALVVGASLPMLRAWSTDVVAWGPSEHEPDTYFLIRAYDDLNDLQTRQDAFYGSAQWREGPREKLLAMIESHLSTVIWLSEASIDDLRANSSAGAVFEAKVL
jgi:hypothetical protein